MLGKRYNDVTDLLDLAVELPRLLYATAVIICTANGIDTLPEVCPEPETSASCMAADDSRQPVALGGDAG